jgi:hypothetical protein
VQFLGHWLKKLLPVVPAVLELMPLIREAEIVENESNFLYISFKSNINMHDPFCERPDVSFKAKIKEEDVLELACIALVEMMLAQVTPQRQCSSHLPQCVLILVIGLDIIHQAVGICTDMSSGFSDQQVHII